MDWFIRHQVADKMSSMMDRMGSEFSRLSSNLDTIRDQTLRTPRQRCLPSSLVRVTDTLASQPLPPMDPPIPIRMKQPPPKTTRMPRGNQGNITLNRVSKPKPKPKPKQLDKHKPKRREPKPLRTYAKKKKTSLPSPLATKKKTNPKPKHKLVRPPASRTILSNTSGNSKLKGNRKRRRKDLESGDNEVSRRKPKKQIANSNSSRKKVSSKSAVKERPSKRRKVSR